MQNIDAETGAFTASDQQSDLLRLGAIDPYSEQFAVEFGQQLHTSKLIDDLNLQRARRAARQTSDRFDQVLTKLGLLPESDLAAQLAVYLRLKPVSVHDLPPEPLGLEFADADFVRRQGLFPVEIDEKAIRYAVVDPFNLEALRALNYLNGRACSVGLISSADFERAYLQLYAHKETAKQIDLVEHHGERASETDLQRLKELANEAPVIKLVNQILATAVESHASDIHVEPVAEGVIIRYRIDGVLRVVQTLDPEIQSIITSRIKIMANLDIAERRLPQDGRIKIAVRGSEVDLRISTIPTVAGESIVLRILDRRHVELNFAKLGFDAAVIEDFRKLMHQPNGIILVTGPTGSGKTTTLYAALKELNSADVKICSVEDPIEFQLSGVNQVQVHSAIGLSFPHALRSILRQDPDTIMIGEIRDRETAQIAIQASLTGHLVFSTLHTNSAVASITRLMDMGIEHYLISSTVKGVLAQRLVRRLCEACAEPLPAAFWPGPQFTPTKFSHVAKRFRKHVGCSACQRTGFKGRSTISELLVLDAEIHRLILKSSPETELEKAARAHGMLTLFESGYLKAARGETTLEEVLRVTRID